MGNMLQSIDLGFQKLNQLYDQQSPVVSYPALANGLQSLQSVCPVQQCYRRPQDYYSHSTTCCESLSLFESSSNCASRQQSLSPLQETRRKTFALG